MFGLGSEQHREKGKPPTRLWILLTVAAIGAGLLLLGGASKTSNASNTAEAMAESEAEAELMRYQSYLESRVQGLTRSVTDTESVTAIVTLSGGFEAVYATELQDGGEAYVILGSGSSASGLLLSRNAPNIEGIGVVIGGDVDALTQSKLLQLLSASFHIPTNRIYITAKK